MSHWENILATLKGRSNPEQFNIWFSSLRCVSLNDFEINLEVPSEYYRSWVSIHFLADIERAIVDVLGNPRKILLSVRGSHPTGGIQNLLPLGEISQDSHVPNPKIISPRSSSSSANIPPPSITPKTRQRPPRRVPTTGPSAPPHSPPFSPAPTYPPAPAYSPSPIYPPAPASFSPTSYPPPPSPTSFSKRSYTAPSSYSPRATLSASGLAAEISQGPSGLNPRYTFEAFVVGPSNQLVHAAALAVAAHPAGEFNPLFIYGGVGLGKTHLMQAVGHAVRARSGECSRVIYRSSEQFINELITSIERKQMAAFREYYRTQCDVLLIDDVQLIAGKERTQEEFFHTFNTLYNSDKQIILSSDQSPQKIPYLEERLKSRFCWGLMADIQRPTIETRIAILRKKSARENMMIPDEVIEFLAQRIDSNVRELEGSLKRINAHALLSGNPPSIEQAMNVLGPASSHSSREQLYITHERIIDIICRHYNITIVDIKGRSRARVISYPRQLAMYLVRTHSNMSYPEIGRVFGKDHTTIMNACRRIKKRLFSDSATRADLSAIESVLNT